MSFFPRIPLKSNDLHDPITFFPRGVRSAYNTFNYCFKASYPTSGINLAGTRTLPSTSGMYLYPDLGKVLYVPYIKVILEIFNESDLYKSFGSSVSVQFINTGITEYSFSSLSYDVAISDKMYKLESLFDKNLFSYIADIEFHRVIRLNGDNGEYLQIKTSNDLAITDSFVNHLFFSFGGWITNQVQEG